MEGVKDRLGDLSWLGITDQAWIEVDAPQPVPPTVEEQAKLINDQIAKILLDTGDKVAIDNVNISKAERQSWVEYRRLIREIPLQGGFPNQVNWPAKPE